MGLEEPNPCVSPVSVLVANESVRIAVPDTVSIDGDDSVSPRTPGAEAESPFLPSAPPATPRRIPLERQGSLKDAKLLLAASDPQRTDQEREGQDFWNQLELLRRVALSQQSEVYVARSKVDNSLSAVKRTVHMLSSKKERERYLREVEVAASLPPSPHLVRYYRCWQEEGHFYVQMELCEGGSLARALDSLRSQGARLPEGDIWRLLREVTSGLRHLHSNQVLHLDVKPENIFMGSDGTFKLGDLGSAVLRNRWEAEEGDGAYVAPELLQDERRASASSDIFSLGATLLEAITLDAKHSLPFPRPGSAFSLPAGWSAALRDCVAAMLERDPAQRCSLQQVEMMVLRAGH